MMVLVNTRSNSYVFEDPGTASTVAESISLVSSTCISYANAALESIRPGVKYISPNISNTSEIFKAILAPVTVWKSAVKQVFVKTRDNVTSKSSALSVEKWEESDTFICEESISKHPAVPKVYVHPSVTVPKAAGSPTLSEYIYGFNPVRLPVEVLNNPPLPEVGTLNVFSNILSLPCKRIGSVQ